MSAALREARIAAGFTQAGLAEKIKMHRASLARIENGAGATLEVAESWAAACGARLVLVREGEDLGMLGEEERRPVEGYRELEPGQRGLVEQLVDVLPRLEPQSLAMLAALLDVAARGASSSCNDDGVAAGRRMA